MTTRVITIWKLSYLSGKEKAKQGPENDLKIGKEFHRVTMKKIFRLVGMVKVKTTNSQQLLKNLTGNSDEKEDLTVTGSD